MSFTRNEIGDRRFRRLRPRPFCIRCLATVLVAVALAGCGGEDPPAAPPTGPDIEVMQVPDGLFDMTTVSIFNNCDWPDQYPGEYWVSISGDTFSLGDEWVGRWDSLNAHSRAESEHIVETFRLCTINQWSTVNLAFTSPDSFVGSVSYYRRLSGECLGPTPCNATWNIFGSRVTGP